MVDRSTEKTIVESLEEDDPELAEEIKKRMFVFEDIVLLDDRAIQKVMREVDTAELAKALKSVDSEVQDKIYRNMSKRASTLLKEDMDYMGPIRLKDVEEAQQRIVAIIRKLEEQGEIVVARAGEEELSYEQQCADRAARSLIRRRRQRFAPARCTVLGRTARASSCRRHAEEQVEERGSGEERLQAGGHHVQLAQGLHRAPEDRRARSPRR